MTEYGFVKELSDRSGDHGDVLFDPKGQNGRINNNIYKGNPSVRLLMSNREYGVLCHHHHHRRRPRPEFIVARTARSRDPLRLHPPKQIFLQGHRFCRPSGHFYQYHAEVCEIRALTSSISALGSNSTSSISS